MSARARPAFPVVALLTLLPALSTSAAAQSAQRPTARAERVGIFPLVGINGHGTRFSREVETAGGGTRTLAWSPTSGAMFGLGLDLPFSPVVSVSLLGTFSSVNYDVSGSAGSGGRTIQGDQDIVRVMGGIHYRVQARAPGFFSAGLGAAFVSPRNSPLPGEEERTEFSGFVGAGLDLDFDGSEIRVDGRLVGTLPNEDVVPPAGGQPGAEFEGFTVDYTLFVAYVIRL